MGVDINALETPLVSQDCDSDRAAKRCCRHVCTQNCRLGVLICRRKEILLQAGESQAYLVTEREKYVVVHNFIKEELYTETCNGF